MDGKSLGFLDKSKTGPKGKGDFAVAFLHILYRPARWIWLKLGSLERAFIKREAP
jgi:hypothetical protein